MQPLKPCARCEQEIPEAFFEGKDAVFCKRCSDEVNDILSKKYSIIEAAHFRAQLRLRSKKIRQRLERPTLKPSTAAPAAAGD